MVFLPAFVVNFIVECVEVVCVGMFDCGVAFIASKLQDTLDFSPDIGILARQPANDGEYLTTKVKKLQAIIFVILTLSQQSREFLLKIFNDLRSRSRGFVVELPTVLVGVIRLLGRHSEQRKGGCLGLENSKMK